MSSEDWQLVIKRHRRRPQTQRKSTKNSNGKSNTSKVTASRRTSRNTTNRGARTTCRKTVHGTHTSAGVHVRSQALRTETCQVLTMTRTTGTTKRLTIENLEVCEFLRSSQRETWRKFRSFVESVPHGTGQPGSFQQQI